jgi:hypothetical protein
MADIFSGFCAHYFEYLPVVVGTSKVGNKKYTKELRDS